MENNPKTFCFGLTQDLDRESLVTFLGLSGNKDFSNLLASRLSSEEIIFVVDSLMGLIHKHLNEEEYHQYFLQETNDNK